MADGSAAATLEDLERKLAALEGELRSASGEHDPPGPGPAAQAPGPIAAAAPHPFAERSFPAAPGPVEPVPRPFGEPVPRAFGEPAPRPFGEPGPRSAEPLHASPPPPVTEPPAFGGWTSRPVPAAPPEDLERLRAQLDRAARALMAECERVLAGLGAGSEPRAEAPWAAWAGLPPAPEAFQSPSAAATWGSGRDPAPAPASLDDVVLAGAISLQAGPFPDIATLSAFEQALRAIPGVADVVVRGYDGAHAQVELVAPQGVALGAELRRSATVAFTVTQAAAGRVDLRLER